MTLMHTSDVPGSCDDSVAYPAAASSASLGGGYCTELAGSHQGAGCVQMDLESVGRYAEKVSSSPTVRGTLSGRRPPQQGADKAPSGTLLSSSPSFVDEPRPQDGASHCPLPSFPCRRDGEKAGARIRNRGGVSGGKAINRPASGASITAAREPEEGEISEAPSGNHDPSDNRSPPWSARQRPKSADDLDPDQWRARARDLWRRALKFAAAEAEARLAKRRPSLWKMYRRVRRLMLLELLVSALLALCSMFLEDDEFYEKYRPHFSGVDGLHRSLAVFSMSLYMHGIVTLRIGFGDILPSGFAGRGIMMGTHLFVSFAVNVQTQIELHGALTETLKRLQRRLGAGKVRHFRDAVAALLFCLHILLTAWAWVAISRLGEAEPWTLMDGIWFSWQSYSTVGYGDLTPLSWELSNVLPTLLLLKLTFTLGYGLLNCVMISAVTSTWRSRESTFSRDRYKRRLGDGLRRARSGMRKRRRTVELQFQRTTESLSSIRTSISSVWSSASQPTGQSSVFLSLARPSTAAADAAQIMTDTDNSHSCCPGAS